MAVFITPEAMTVHGKYALAKKLIDQLAYVAYPIHMLLPVALVAHAHGLVVHMQWLVQYVVTIILSTCLLVTSGCKLK